MMVSALRVAMHSRLLLIAILLAYACNKKENDAIITTPVENSTFINPLLPSGPDPWVFQKDSLYVYTHTVGDRIVIYKTTKMSELGNAVPATIWSPPDSTPYSRNIWAPEIHFLDGKWYTYFAADDGNINNHRMYVLENSAADPASGSWVFKGKITDASDKWAIDGTVFEHDNHRYFLWSGWEGDINVQQNLYIAKMRNPWTIEGERVLISVPTYSWERIDSPDVNEGPEVVRNGNRVFITYSASGCWTDDYAIGLLSLKAGGDPMHPGDWIKSANPVFTKKPENGAYAPGQNGFFKSKDGKEDWIIYHANTSPGLGCSNSRNPRMQKFTWNADGSPNFGEPVPINQKIKKPSGE